MHSQLIWSFPLYNYKVKFHSSNYWKYTAVVYFDVGFLECIFWVSLLNTSNPYLLVQFLITKIFINTSYPWINLQGKKTMGSHRCPLLLFKKIAFNLKMTLFHMQFTMRYKIISFSIDDRFISQWNRQDISKSVGWVHMEIMSQIPN